MNVLVTINPIGVSGRSALRQGSLKSLIVGTHRLGRDLSSNIAQEVLMPAGVTDDRKKGAIVELGGPKVGKWHGFIIF